MRVSTAPRPGSARDRTCKKLFLSSKPPLRSFFTFELRKLFDVHKCGCQFECLRAAVALKNLEAPFVELTEVFLDRARSGKDTNRPELQRLLAMIRVIGQQMDVLAERLTMLLKSVSPVAVFRQMERLEEVKRLEEQKLSEAQRNEVTADAPALLAGFSELMKVLSKMANDVSAGEIRARITRSLVHKVEQLAKWCARQGSNMRPPD